MRLQNPSLPDWVIELDDKDKEAIKAHIAAGWQELPKRRTTKKVSNVTAEKTASETSSVSEAEETN